MAANALVGLTSANDDVNNGNDGGDKCQSKYDATNNERFGIARFEIAFAIFV